MLAGEVEKLCAEAAIPILIEGVEAILFLGINIRRPYSGGYALALRVGIAGGCVANARLRRKFSISSSTGKYPENMKRVDRGHYGKSPPNSATEKFAGISSGRLWAKVEMS